MRLHIENLLTCPYVFSGEFWTDLQSLSLSLSPVLVALLVERHITSDGMVWSPVDLEFDPHSHFVK